MDWLIFLFIVILNVFQFISAAFVNIEKQQQKQQYLITFFLISFLFLAGKRIWWYE